MVVKIPFRKKDALLKHWHEYAVKKGVNISNIVSKAVQYYQLTNKYMPIGTVTIDHDIPDSSKNIYYAANSFLASQIERWKADSIHPSTEIKRILKNGLRETGVYSIISEIEAHELVKSEIVSRNGTQIYEKVEIARQETVEKPLIRDEIIQKENIEKIIPKSRKKEQADFVMSMLLPGCGLGES